LAPAQAAVRLDGVSQYFGDFPALAEVSLEVEAGQCLALIGRNGAGKTTLLRLVAGFARPARGRVAILGEDPRSEAARRRMGFIGHGAAVYDEFSGLENLELFGRLYGVREPRRAAAGWLERVGLAAARHAPVREYSRGMRQRLSLARAFLHDPALLLLDEPFTALDDRAVRILQSLLREALERGAAVLLSTHQLREALEPASRVALLERGRLAHLGARTPEMLADPGLLYARYGEGG